MDALSPMGGSGPVCLPTHGPIGGRDGEVEGLPLQTDHPDHPGLAQDAMVLGLSGDACHGPSMSSAGTRPVDSTIKRVPSRESGEPQSPCVASRASTIRRQGFSEAVAA